MPRAKKPGGECSAPAGARQDAARHATNQRNPRPIAGHDERLYTAALFDVPWYKRVNNHPTRQGEVPRSTREKRVGSGDWAVNRTRVSDRFRPMIAVFRPPRPSPVTENGLAGVEAERTYFGRGGERAPGARPPACGFGTAG